MSVLYKNFDLLVVSQKLSLYILCNTHSDTSAEQNKLINYKFSSELWLLAHQEADFTPEEHLPQPI